MSRVFRRTLRLLLLALFASGCSADSAPEPEPNLDTKGAFLAVIGDRGDIELYRTLAVIGDGEPYDTFFVIPYSVTPSSFAEARELAKNADLPHGDTLAIARGYITSHESKVVWYRSVTIEEEATFR